MTTTDEKPVPLWQKAIGFVIGTAVGGIIYGIFLQALLVQSLLIDRKPLDPAQWKEHLSRGAWIAGALLFSCLIFVPFRFLVRDMGATVLATGTEGGVVWFLIALILLIQIATVRYATMRPELCTVEHPHEFYSYGRWLKVSFTLGLWKNWVQLLIVFMEFVQLLSMALDGGYALQSAGVGIISPTLLLSVKAFKEVVWQFGMIVPTAGATVDAGFFQTGFGLLCGFSGLYILLCGVFIALDLTVDSSLSPLLFTILAGGFYATITSGLLLVIFYSPAPSHVIVCLIMLAYYSSTAVFVSIYRSDVKKAAQGEIRVTPVFIALERVSKGILAAISVATNSPESNVREISTLCFCLSFVCLLAWIRPYSAMGVTKLRIGCVSIAAWTAFLVTVAGFMTSSEYGAVLTGVLITGWILIPLLLTLVPKCVGRKRSFRRLFRSESATVLTIENPILVTMTATQKE
jgi:hypothetical protein